MTAVGLGEVNYKFLIDEELKKRVDKAFEEQKTSLTVGTTALLDFFLAQPSEMRAVMLGQVRGDATVLLAEEVLRRAAGEGRGRITSGKPTRAPGGPTRGS